MKSISFNGSWDAMGEFFSPSQKIFLRPLPGMYYKPLVMRKLNKTIQAAFVGSSARRLVGSSASTRGADFSIFATPDSHSGVFYFPGGAGNRAIRIGTVANRAGVVANCNGTTASSTGIAANRSGTVADSIGTVANPKGNVANSNGTVFSRTGTVAIRIGTVANAIGNGANPIGTA